MLHAKGRWLVPAVAAALAAAGVAVAAMATNERIATSRVGVRLTEFRVSVIRTLPPGRTTFVVSNRGKIVHAFAISGPLIGRKRIPGTIAPRKTKQLTVTLAAGRYVLWCPIPGHAALGMRLTVRVTAAAGTGVTAAPPPPQPTTTAPPHPTTTEPPPTTESG